MRYLYMYNTGCPKSHASSEKTYILHSLCLNCIYFSLWKRSFFKMSWMVLLGTFSSKQALRTDFLGLVQNFPITVLWTSAEVDGRPDRGRSATDPVSLNFFSNRETVLCCTCLLGWRILNLAVTVLWDQFSRPHNKIISTRSSSVNIIDIKWSEECLHSEH